MAYPSGLGNGTGFIYLVAPNGTDILTSFRNDTAGRERILVLCSGPKTSRTSSTVSYSTTLSLSGNRVFLYDDAAAVEGVLGAATEITDLVMVRASTNAIAYIAATIATGVISLTRTSNTALVSLATEGAAATDTLDTITYSELINNDRLILYGPSGGQVTTVSSGTGNIFLSGGTSFVTSSSTNQLELRYWNAGGGVATGWYEIGRSVVFPTVANLRTQSVAEPVQGITNLTMSTGATTTLVPGTDKEFLYVTGSPVLIAPIDIATGGTPIDGDTFTVFYRATPTVGAFAVTVFGTTLTATQTQQYLKVTTVYSSVSAAWRTVVLPDTTTLDFATTTQLAAKEDDLGTPAATGYVLSSTTGDVRSWIPNGNFPVLHNDTSNDGTTAVLTEEILKTYAITAGLMSTDGDTLKASGIYQTAANANAKTETIYFGATAIGTITGNFNADTVFWEAEINRIDNTNQSAWCSIRVFDTAAPGTLVGEASAYTLPAETLSGAVNIQMASTNGAAAANDSVARQFTVRLLKKQ